MNTTPQHDKTPDPAAVWLSLANCLIAMPALMLRESYDSTRILAALSFVIFGLLLFRKLTNVLFLARTLLLGVIGYYPMAVKVLAGPDALFSLYERSTQSFDIVTVMYVATSLALLGNEVGLYLGSRRSRTPAAPSPENQSEFWRTIFYAAVPAVALVSLLVIRSNPTVFVATYGSQTGESPLLGNTQAIGIICLLAAFVALYKSSIAHGRTTLAVLAIVFLAWAMFARGFRQDVVTALLGLAVCHGLVHGRAFRISLRNIGVVAVIVVVVEFMGVARGMLATDYVTLHEVWAAFMSTFFEGDGTYQAGTVGPIATTFANTVYLVDSHTMNLLYGKSFLEFIARTPPDFLYPGRPRDYAWMFPDYGLSAGGGIFELAEAYMNFGLLGACVVPGVISFLMAKAFRNVLSRQSVASYFLLFSFLGMFLRGAWYQIFAFYKSFLTAVILLALFTAFHAVRRSSRGSSVRREPFNQSILDVRP